MVDLMSQSILSSKNSSTSVLFITLFTEIYLVSSRLVAWIQSL